MKTLKAVSPKKIVTWSLAVMFSFLQIVPAGWAAAMPADEARARSVSVPVKTLEASEEFPTDPLPVVPKSAAPLDSTAFQLNDNPLSPATQKITTQEKTGESVAGLKKLPEAKLGENRVALPGPEQSLGGKDFAVELPDVFKLPEAKPEEKQPVSTLPLPGENVAKLPVEIHPMPMPPNDELIAVLPPKRQPPVVDLPSVFRLPLLPVQKEVNTDLLALPREWWAYMDQLRKELGEDFYVTIIQNDAGEYQVRAVSVKKGSVMKSIENIYDPANRKLIREVTTDLRTGQKITTDHQYSAVGILIRSVTETSVGGVVTERVEKIYHYMDGRLMQEVKTIPAKPGGAERVITTDYEYRKPAGILDFGPKGVSRTVSVTTVGGIVTERVERFYDPDGKLIRHVEQTYVHINGRQLLSSQVSKSRAQRSFLGQYGLYRTPNNYSEEYEDYESQYYGYDSQGNQVAQVHMWERRGPDGQPYSFGEYFIYDASTGLWESGYTGNLDVKEIHGLAAWSIIERATFSKLVYVGGSAGDRHSSTHIVIYIRNASGDFVPVSVYDNRDPKGRAHYIVRGKPDVLSGETDDMKIINGQQVSGHTVYFADDWRTDKNGNRVSVGYRLFFYDANGNPTAVDFPAEDTVMLNGKEYKITIEKEGLVHLEEALPPAVQAYAEKLQAQFDTNKLAYIVKAIRDEGFYRISITNGVHIDCKGDVCPQAMLLIKPGQLTHISFNISSDGLRNISTLKVFYQGVALDEKTGLLLFDGVRKILIRDSFEKNSFIDVGGVRIGGLIFITDEEALAAMAKINVTKVENGAVFFTFNGKNYKAYRNASGEAKVEEINAIPSAVREYMKTLQKQLGGRFGVEVTRNKAGDYLVQVRDGIVYKVAPTSGLQSMTLHLFSSGVVDSSDMVFTYYAVGGKTVVVGKGPGAQGLSNLFFWAVQTLQSCVVTSNGVGACRGGGLSQMEVLSILANSVNVVSALENGTVRFTYKGEYYQASRDPKVGTPKLIREPLSIPSECLPQIQEKLDALFGAGKARFVATSNFQADYGSKVGWLFGNLVDEKGEVLVFSEVDFIQSENGQWQLANNEYDQLKRLTVSPENYEGLLQQLGDPSGSPLVLGLVFVKNPNTAGPGGEIVFQHQYHFRAAKEGRITLRYIQTVSGGMKIIGGINSDASLLPGDNITELTFQVGPVPAVKEKGVIYLEIGQTYDLVLSQGGAGVEVPRHYYSWGPFSGYTKKIGQP